MKERIKRGININKVSAIGVVRKTQEDSMLQSPKSVANADRIKHTTPRSPISNKFLFFIYLIQ